MVSLEGVSFGYGGTPTLDKVSLDIPPGSFHFLTGPSGAGKTTLLKLLYLERQPQAGTMRILGSDPATLGRDALTALRRRIGIVFQEFRLLDHMTVRENIALPLRVSGERVSDHGRNIDELMRWVGLHERAGAQPPTLSAGEKQRAAIARAVIRSPELVLADEPTGNVDPEMGARILRLLIELNALGKTVLVATHDLSMIRNARGAVQARILRLKEGRLTVGAAEL